MQDNEPIPFEEVTEQELKEVVVQTEGAKEEVKESSAFDL